MKSALRSSFLALALAALAGCATPSANPGQPTLVRYQPKNGERTTFSAVILSDVDANPVLLVNPAPELRYEPKYVGTTAHVVVEITVDPKGTVTDARLVSADPEFAGPPTAATFLRARFRPAMKNDAPVSCHMRVIWSFTL